MTKSIKWKLTAIILLLAVVTNGMAQVTKAFHDTTYDAKKKITIETPAGEYNEFELAPPSTLHTFAGKIGKTIVYVLLKPGDYAKYYEGKTTVTTPNLWVFDPTHTKTCFKSKKDIQTKFYPTTGSVKINAMEIRQRFCQFLGIDTISIKSAKLAGAAKKTVHIRDTIVALEVPLDSLFRPAYDTDIHLNNISQTVIPALSSGNKRYHMMRINIIPQINRWFADQQYHNTAPWTRLGYTYDWGNTTDHFGATEYILKATKNPVYTIILPPEGNTKVKGKKYCTVKEFLK